VTIQGHVDAKKSKRLFDIIDDTGKMTVLIPEYIQRDQGTPKMGETIRVRGQFDDKTFKDHRKRKDGSLESVWGIRVSSLERNLEAGARNPSPGDAQIPDPISRTTASPAAVASSSEIVSPKVSAELKDRLAAGRVRVHAARSRLEEADLQYVRGLQRDAQGPELEALVQDRRAAEKDVEDATAAIPPLVQEARDAGVAEGVIDMYEQGLTKPRP
jgi:hypothetical protein